MYFLVYKIINTINGKHYTGAHQTLDKEDGYMGSGSAIKNAIKKHGLESFKKEILFEAQTTEEMFFKEKELVVLGPQSYNLMSGGSTGAPFGKPRPEDIRRKISASKLGKLYGKYKPRNKPNKPRIRQNKPETIQRSRKNRPETKRRKSFGIPRTEEVKAKISATKKKKHLLEKFNIKIL